MENEVKVRIGSKGFDARFPRKPACLPTGFDGLDYAIGGLRAGSITCFGSAPCTSGNGHLLCELALRAAESGINVLFFSLEMPRWQAEGRFLALRSGVHPMRIHTYCSELSSSEVDPSWYDRFARPTEAELARVKKARNHVSELPIRVEDSPGLTLSDLRLAAERLRAEIGPDANMLVVINYRELMFDYPSRGLGNAGKDPRDITRAIWDEKSQSAQFSFALRAIALDCNAPVVTRVRVSRRSRYHDLSTLEDYDYSYGSVSGSLFVDQDCDVLISLDEIMPCDSEGMVGVKMRILKNSYGGLLPLTVELPAPFLEPEQISCTAWVPGMLW